MRRFYKQIRFDQRLKRFYVACTVCSERLYGKRIPLLWMSEGQIDLLEHGQGDWLTQQSYNHAKANSVQYLSRFYDQCPECGAWICEKCYNTAEEKGCFFCNPL